MGKLICTVKGGVYHVGKRFLERLIGCLITFIASLRIRRRTCRTIIRYAYVRIALLAGVIITLGSSHELWDENCMVFQQSEIRMGVRKWRLVADDLSVHHSLLCTYERKG